MVQEPKGRQHRKHQFYHEISTRPGQSGAPILVSLNGRSYVMGIHVGYKWKKQINVGRKIDNYLVERLKEWAGVWCPSLRELTLVNDKKCRL